MKRLTTLMILAISLAVSCGKKETPQPEPPVPPRTSEPVEYSFRFGVTVETIVRNNADVFDLHTRSDGFVPQDYRMAIQVYETELGMWEKKNYAYGIFDDLDDLKIELYPGYKYDIVCKLVDEVSDHTVMFFRHDDGRSNDITDGFVFSTTKSLLEHDIFKAYVNSMAFYKYYPVVSFYGATELTATNEGGTINVPMSQMNFSVELNVEDLPEGEVRFSLNKGYEYISVTETQPGNSGLFTVHNVADHYSNPLHTDPETYTIKWIKSDDTSVTIPTPESVNISRMKIHTFNVRFKNGDNGFGFDFEQKDMEQGDIKDIEY